MEEQDATGSDISRTTIQLPEPLWAHAKAVAARQKCSLHEVVTQALNEWLPRNFALDGRRLPKIHDAGGRLLPSEALDPNKGGNP